MQPLESFTAIADVLGRNRKISFNELDGLTLSNLSGREATILVGAIEKLDGQLLAHLLAGRTLVVADEKTGARTPDSAPNQAQWSAATPKPASEPATGPQKRSAAPRTAPSKPVDARTVETTAPQGATQAPLAADAFPLYAQDGPAKEPAVLPKPKLPVDKPPAVVLVAEPTPEPKPKAKRPRPTPTAADLLGKAPTPTPKGKSETKKKAPPRGAELFAVGAKYQSVEIAKVVDHSDGGRLLILVDGARVKVSKKGKEIARTDAPPADIDLSVDFTPADEIKLKPKKEKEKGAHPQEIMDTRIVREVITHLLDTGVEGIEPLTEACLELRAAGAKSFTSLDDDAVRRRVRSSLTIMDRA